MKYNLFLGEKRCDSVSRTNNQLSFQRAIFHPMRSEVFAEFFGHHRFVIGPISNIHLRNRVTFEDDEMCTNPI